MSSRPLARSRVPCLVLAALVVLGIPSAAFAAEPGSARAGGSAAQGGGGFTQVSQAVAAGFVDRKVATELESKGRVDALVTFEAGATLARAESAAPKGKGRSDAILRAVRPIFAGQKRNALGGSGAITVLREWPNLAASYVRIRSAAALLKIVQSAGVTGVRENRAYRPTLQESLKLIGRVDATDGLINPSHVGAGTAVAILDTGLDYSRSTTFGSCGAGPQPDTTGDCKVAYAQDFAPEDNMLDGNISDGCTAEPACHGTNVAGVVLGVAPGAKVIALDVFQGTLAYDETINSALDWVVANQTTYNIRAANLSLGNTTWNRTICWNSPEEPGFASLRAVRVLPVVASGNSADLGPDGAYTDGIASPACTAGALSVGAVYDGDVGGDPYGCGDTATAADKITCFSQGGPSLGLVAPGAFVTAADLTRGGTSQATPHVAGAVAVLAGAKPTATPYQLEQILRLTGHEIADTRPVTPRNVRRLALNAAIAALAEPLPVQPMWTEPALTAGPDTTWSFGSSLAKTGWTLHNVHMAWGPGFDPMMQVEYVRSTNNAASWLGSSGTATPTRLNKSWEHGSYGAVGTAGNNVYAVWTRMSSVGQTYVPSHSRSIHFRRSTDQGVTWSTTILGLSSTSGRVDQPSIAAYGTYVFVVWTDSNTGAIRLATSTNSGVSFTTKTIGTTNVTLGDGSGRWGMPVVSAYGSNVAVAWLATWSSSGYGALRALISGNRGSTWAARTLDTDSRDRAAVAASGGRIAFSWVDTAAARLQVWESGVWQPVRTASSAFSSTGTYKSGYSPAVALYGTVGVSVAWSSCRYKGCPGANLTGGIDLYWRESTSNGSTWRTIAGSSGPILIASSQQSQLRRANDAADIEYVSTTRRYIAYGTWTADAPYPARMYIRTGVG